MTSWILTIIVTVVIGGQPAMTSAVSYWADEASCEAERGAVMGALSDGHRGADTVVIVARCGRDDGAEMFQ